MKVLCRSLLSIPLSIVIGCSADGSGPPPPPPAKGDLRVTTITTGSGRPDGYTISVPNVGNQSIGANASAIFTGLLPRAYLVTLSSIPANCTAPNPNPRSATVVGGDTTAIGFSLSCDSTGSLEVRTITNGSWVPSGYRVWVDNGTDQPIGPTASVVYTKLSAGDHQVHLDDIPATCGGGPQQRQVTIGFETTTTAILDVNCYRSTGEQGPAAGWIDPDGVSDGENSVVLVTGSIRQVNDAEALWNDVGDPTPGANLNQPYESYASALILTIDASGAIPGQDSPSVDASVRVDCSTDGGSTWTECITVSRSYTGFGTMSYNLGISATPPVPAIPAVPAQFRMRLILKGLASGFNGGRTASARIQVFRTAWLQDNYPVTW